MPNPTERVDLDDLVGVIETLQGLMKRHDETIGSFKYRTRMLLIDPLLDALGWDTSDPAMVIPDYHAGDGQADYALLGRAQGARSDKPIAIIEAKQLSAHIVDADRVLALINAKTTGATYVGLTNGDRWEFYEVFSQSSIDDRRILSISIRYQGALNCARELLSAFLRLTETTGGPTMEGVRRRSRNYYYELDIEPSASSIDIRKAYLRRVKQLHPDVSKRSQANRETARLNHVYAILSNQQLRREYDAIIFPREPDTVTPPTVEREPRAETTRRNKDNKRHTKSKTTSRKTGPAQSRRGSRKRKGFRKTGPARSRRSTTQSSGRSDYRYPRRGFGFWRGIRRLVAALLVIAIIVTAAVIGGHWYNGATLGAAVEMMAEDYRLAAACPTEPETVFAFLGRAPYPNDHSAVSVRYPDDWKAQVCSGDLAYDQSADLAGVSGPAQTGAAMAGEASAPDAHATATPGTRTIVEVPVRRSVATPRSDGGQSVLPLAGTATPSLAATVTPVITVTLHPTHTPMPVVTLIPPPAPPPTPTPLPTASATPGVTPTLPPTATASSGTAVTLPVVPTTTPGITPTPSPAATNTPAPPPTATNTPTPMPTATMTPTPTPIPPPPMRHIEEKSYMLELINSERVSAGLKPVVLGDNAAAQLHAEAALENCFSSHWGIDGLKPYMRYSLAGSYQSNGENGSGLDYCIKASDGYRANGSAEQEIRQAMEGLMDSPGHRDNILRPWHKKVNIGLAWDRYNFKVIQHFEGDYVEYEQLPVIDKGVLRMSGMVKNGVRFNDDFRDLSVQVYYDPPPHTLTRGQVARTYCYDNGLPVAALRPPLTGRSFYPMHEFTSTYRPCPDPYDVPANADAPRSHDEAHLFWQAAYLESLGRQAQTITVPWITALEWTARGEDFSVSADLWDVLAKHGEGVYSLVVWVSIDGEDIVISEYSIFHDVTAPDTFDVDKPQGG